MILLILSLVFKAKFNNQKLIKEIKSSLICIKILNLVMKFQKIHKRKMIIKKDNFFSFLLLMRSLKLLSLFKPKTGKLIQSLFCNLKIVSLKIN